MPAIDQQVVMVYDAKTGTIEKKKHRPQHSVEDNEDRVRREKQFVEGMQDLYIRAMGVDPSSEEAKAMRADLDDLYQSLR